MDCFLPADLSVALTLTMPLGNVPHQVHAIHIMRDALAVVKVFAIAVLSRPATESLEYPSRPETVHPAGKRSSRAAHLGDLAQRDHVHIKPQLSTFSGCSRTAVAHRRPEKLTWNSMSSTCPGSSLSAASSISVTIPLVGSARGRLLFQPRDHLTNQTLDLRERIVAV